MTRLLRLERLLSGLLVPAVAAAVLALATGLALAWRLSQGPIEVAWLARKIERAVDPSATPARLSIGKATVEWAGFAHGAGRGLELHLHDTRLLGFGDAKLATLDDAALSLSIGRLLLGQLVPRTIAIDGLDLNIKRDNKGRVSLDLLQQPGDEAGPNAAGAGPSVSETLAELSRPPQAEGAPPSATHPMLHDGIRSIALLRSVHVGRSLLVLHDAGVAGPVRLDLAALDLLRQAGGGVLGQATATLGVGAAQAKIALQAELDNAGGTRLHLALDPVDASAIQAALPSATVDGHPPDVEMLDAPVHGAATLRLDQALQPRDASMRLDSGAGRIRLAGTEIGFDRVTLDAAASWDHPGWTRPQHLTVTQLQAVVRAPGGTWPTTLAMSGQIDAVTAGLDGAIDATLDHLAFADIGGLWPPRWGGHLRPWLVPNITGGVARDGAVKLTFTAPADLSDATVTKVNGSVRGDDVTVWWVRPVPPVEQAQALLTIDNPQSMDIVVPTARQGTAALRDGVIHITGLQDKDQFLAMGVNVQAGVPEVLSLLRHPRLHLLDRKPIPMRNPAGALTGRLSVNLLLKDQLQFEDIHIQSSAHLTGLRLGGLIAGRDLESGDVRMDVTSDTLKATGTAAVAGIASTLSIDMDFRGGPPSQVVQRAQATGRATPAQLAAAGLDPGGLFASGAGLFTGRYTQRRDNTADVQVSADLRDAALSLAGWGKPPGQPADASASLLLRGDQMLGLDALHAQGPGMAVDGHAEMVGPRPLLLVLDHIVLGGTQARGQIRLPATPGAPIRATLDGAVLDLGPQLSRKAELPGKAPDPAWIADVRFDRVLLAGNDRGIGGVTAHAEHDGRRLSAMTATSSGPEKLSATVTVAGAGRHLVAKAADAGAVLRAFDLLDKVQGGRLALDATYDDTRFPPPLSGTAELSDFRVRDAPVLGKLLQAVTIYGVVDALSGPGLSFSNLVLPFRWDGSLLDVTDARAFSASLGLTARGRLDSVAKTIDIQGTVVPAYLLNSLLGRLPMVGRLFRAERDGGLFAVDYGLHGPAADPTIRVNPLSALTPGFLRGLFHLAE